MFSRAIRLNTRAIQARAPLASRRTLMTLKDHKYTAHATARGQGRDGEVESDDDCGLKLRLAMPRSLGGKGDGQNPEQLFAMGYSACLLSAIQLASNNLGKTDEARHAVVHTQVHLGKPNDMDGFGLEVEIQVEGVSQDLVDAGHEACPYSRALKHGAKVTVTKGDSGDGNESKSEDGTEKKSDDGTVTKSENGHEVKQGDGSKANASDANRAKFDDRDKANDMGYQ